MADKDTSNDDTSTEDKDLDVETDEDTSTEDENQDDDDQEDEDDDTGSDDDNSDDDSEDDDSEDDSDEDDEEDEEKPEFKKAFSQIKGDSPEEYLPNLEEAYRKSSAEGKKLAQSDRDKQARLDKIAAAVAKNPDLAKAIEDATAEGEVSPVVDPGVAKARQDYEDEIVKDLSDFMKEHPEIEDDEDVQKEFMENVETVGEASRKRGRIIKPAVAYKRAWNMMEHDDSKEKIATAAKNTASKPKTSSGSKKKRSKGEQPKLTDKQIAMGKKMGLTEKQLLEQKEAEEARKNSD